MKNAIFMVQGMCKSVIFDRNSVMLIEEFKNCLPERVTPYLNEQKPVKLSDAAALADEYVLTHKSVFGERLVAQKSGR